MTRLRTEQALLGPVSGYFQRKSYRFQREELPFYEYRIDLYGFSRVRERTLAVELKIKDWKRAYEQALLYQLCADLVVVAMPDWTVRRVDQELFARWGIGLLTVSTTGCRLILEPSQSEEVLTSYRDELVRLIQEKN